MRACAAGCPRCTESCQRDCLCTEDYSKTLYIVTRIIVCGSHATISKAYVHVHVVACICLRVVCSSGMLLVYKWELVAVPEWHTLHKLICYGVIVES